MIRIGHRLTQIDTDREAGVAKVAVDSPRGDDADARRLEELTVILIAPDVSEQLGGEAMKALHILRELRRLGVDVHQITHERRREEMRRIEPNVPIHYVKDSALQRFIWKSVILRNGIQIPFMYGAAKIARRLVDELREARPQRNIVVHYTSPVSPVLPCFPTPEVATVIGPINGNIHYPPAFQGRERTSYRLRRRLLPLAQQVHRVLFRGKQGADLILVAGGQRTADSLLLAGCRPEQFLASLDSGVPNRLADLPRIAHKGQNLRFVHNGRLVTHKGLDLAIRAVARAKQPVELDIIGRGPVEPALRELAAQLGVGERVRFLGWIEDHSKLPQVLADYRGYVFPSLAEANGIVVQEAMLLGLPVICLRWGGPALLVTPDCGVLVEPAGEIRSCRRSRMPWTRWRKTGPLRSGSAAPHERGRWPRDMPGRTASAPGSMPTGRPWLNTRTGRGGVEPSPCPNVKLVHETQRHDTLLGRGRTAGGGPAGRHCPAL